MRRTLVTGATGFVGSRLVRALVERGEHVRVLARPASSLRALADLPQDLIEVRRGDILLEHEVYRALIGCDRLYHVAAVYKMWASDPREILEPSIQGTEATLEAARKRGLDKIVVTSSVAAVGVNDAAAPMDENWKFNLPEDTETYVLAKRKAEELALSYVAKGVPVVVVNPTGVFGPGDWKPSPSGATVLQFLRWRWPWGFPVTDGGINVVDVDDVAAGHIAAMEKGRVGERYLLGGENVTFEGLIRTLSDITGLRGPGARVSKGVSALGASLLELGARWTGGEPALTRRMVRDYLGRYLWVTSAKAQEELGYEPRAAYQALLRSVHWYLYHGYVEDDIADRLRLDPRTA